MLERCYENWVECCEGKQNMVIIPLPKEHHTIGYKWVYKVKYKVEDTVERYKACLVAKGYTQQKGLDHISH